MSQKIIDLLKVFQTRATAPELAGKTCRTQAAFELAATELELAIRESNPEVLASTIPLPVLSLIHEALHFDSSDEECWEALGLAAINIQSGPS